jgi:hypothetical protein
VDEMCLFSSELLGPAHSERERRGSGVRSGGRNRDVGKADRSSMHMRGVARRAGDGRAHAAAIQHSGRRGRASWGSSMHGASEHAHMLQTSGHY